MKKTLFEQYQGSMESSEKAIQAALFNEFHKANPQIYTLFKRWTFELIRLGYTNGAAWMVLERIRLARGARIPAGLLRSIWPSRIVHISAAGKISKSLIVGYTEQFATDFPDHKDFFEIRGSSQ